MNITYEEILDFDDLNDFEPQQVIGMLGLIFETSKEQRNIQDLKKGLDFSEKQNLDKFEDHDKMIYYYNVANGWLYLQMLNQKINSDEYWSFKFQELEKQIINLRLALKYSENVSDDFNKCQILTNLGNLLSQIGRFSEAQNYWNKAIGITPDFSMAVGNIGFGLVNYAKVLYDVGQQSLFLKFAYKFLTKSLKLDIYKEAKDRFFEMSKDLEGRFNKNKLSKIPNLDIGSLGKSKREIEYRTWCLNNQLFLNPLNDICMESIASNDCLLLPSMTLEFDQSPVYQTIYNQLKQEYVSSRFLLYEGINHKGLHFSDRKNLLMDTLDNATYSFSIEKIKIAFRVCYSLLDKIGYILNDYLELGLTSQNVSFRKIWYIYKNNNPIELNPKITSSHNWAFRGLFWLSKDLYEKHDIVFLSSLEPEAQELADIRNFIEHKSFKTVEHGDSELVDNDLTFLISRNKFEIKTLKLFKLVRAAMIYLSLGINLEEQKKSNDEPILPIDFIELKDDYKY